MLQDIHYYCIGVLAAAAGFDRGDALTIAYASQYTDDATESRPIPVGDCMFDPVRTAHIGLEALDWTVQRKIYIPFHYIPPGRIQSPDDSFITRAGSAFAAMIVKEAFRERNRLRRLCRIGVALHTFADTWAHDGFSGRHHEENDVEGIWVKGKNTWLHLRWKNIRLDLHPQIGHAEAGILPDQSFLKWKYRNTVTGRDVERDNPVEFFSACESIYGHLRQESVSSPGKTIPWNDIKGMVKRLLETKQRNDREQCAAWKKAFGDMFHPLEFHYDKKQWRNDALQPEDETQTDWDGFRRAEFKRLRFRMWPGFYESPWVVFHQAAQLQRHLVLENFL